MGFNSAFKGLTILVHAAGIHRQAAA